MNNQFTKSLLIAFILCSLALITPQKANATCTANITGLKFYDLVGSNDVTISNNGTYSLSALPSSFTLESIYSGSMGSMKFTITGSLSTTIIENYDPYNYPAGGGAWTHGAGTYTVKMQAYHGSNASGNICDTKTITFTLTSGSSCSEFTSGGTISGAETNCGSYNPTIITSTALPSGGHGGTTEYIWLENSTASNSGATVIPGATGPTYDPGTINTTTFYRRCVRRCGGNYIKESNWVKKEVTSCPSNCCTDMALVKWNMDACAGCTSPNNQSYSEFTATYVSSCISVNPSTVSGTALPHSCITGYAGKALCNTAGNTFTIESAFSPSSTQALDITALKYYVNNPLSFNGYGACYGPYSGNNISQYLLKVKKNGSLIHQEVRSLPNTWTVQNIDLSGYSSLQNLTSSTTITIEISSAYVYNAYFDLDEFEIIGKVCPTCDPLTNGGSIGSNQSFCNSGTPAAFTSTGAPTGGSGSTINYRWQSRPVGGSWSTISGATNATYNASTISQSTQYRRQAKRALCGNWKNSNVLTVTIQPGVDAGVNGSTTVCDHSTATIDLAGLITGEDAGGVWTRTSGTGGTFSASNGTYIPAVGATTSTFKYTVAGTTPCPNDYSVATVNINVCQIMVSGTVFNDINGLTDNDVNGIGIGTPSSTPVFVSLVNSAGNVFASTQVNNNGTYQFQNVTTNSTYSMVLSTVAGVVGNTPPSADLPNGWLNTGESPNNATSDGTVDGMQSFSVGIVDVPNIDFGIQQPPTPGIDSIPPTPNPGDSVCVVVPGSEFSGIDASAGGIVTNLTICTFPSNIDRIEINGVAYTSGNWPVSGVTIPTNAQGEPTQGICIDPQDGLVTNEINYTVTDNAGATSVCDGKVIIKFYPISLSGNVYNDTDGPAHVNGLGINTPSSTQLYANLIDASGDVAATTAVTSNGSYNFPSVKPNTNYSVVLSTTQGTNGNTAPTPALPFGWKNVSEDCCDNTGNDGSTDGVTTAAVGTTDVTNVNFGIMEPLTIGNRVFVDLNQDGNRDGGEPFLPNASVNLYTDNNNDNNPDGAAIQTTTTNGSGVYRFDDLLPGRYIVGVTPPAPASGSPYVSTEGAAQSVDPNNNVNNDDNGILTVGNETRSGVIIMAAGTEPTNDDTYNAIPDNNSNMSIDFGFYQEIKLSGIVFQDESGPANVDGSPIGSASGNQLYAHLIDGSGNVEAIKPISNLGMYEFLDLRPNTSYSVVLSDIQGNVNSPAPAAHLPEGWVNVAEDCCDGIGNDGTPDGINLSPTVTSDVPNVNFGIREPVALGNLVWVDSNKNGIVDGNEGPLENAVVNLYEDNNNDGNADGAAIATMTTQSDGLYKFVDLYSGKYIVGVTPPSITGGTLESSSVGEETNPNLDVDNNDNGITKIGDEVRSGTINLISNTEPQGELPNNTAPVPDSNSNLTVDFGFFACPTNFVFDSVDLCVNSTFDLTSVEPALFTGGSWRQNNVLVPTPTAVGSGTYTYTYNEGNCSASGSITLSDNIPDYTPTIQIAPSAITGTSNVRVILTLSEILNKKACSDLYILVPKLLPRFQFTFDNTATSIAGVPVENGNWEFANSNPNFYVWRYTANGGLFPSGGTSTIGYIGTYDPNNTDGQSTFSVQVFQGSGGETNQLNNTDSELLIYFR